MLFAFVARVNQYLSDRKESGIPDQKGVLDMIRGLPDDYLFPCNNKVWHGTVALHFCFFRDALPITDCYCGNTPLRLPHNAIPPEKVLRHHHAQRWGSKGGRHGPLLHLSCVFYFIW